MLRTLLAFLLLFGAVRLPAFEAEEHTLIADHAFELVAQQHPLAADPAVRKVLDQFNGSLSYGHLAAWVDWSLDSSLLFQRLATEPAPAFPLGAKDLNEKVQDEEMLFKSLRLARASHNNDNHFQRGVLFSFFLWHKLALGLAKDDGNLYAALAANAVSSHFLADFFAPGHITAARYGMWDVYVKLIHDQVNHAGIEFKPLGQQGILHRSEIERAPDQRMAADFAALGAEHCPALPCTGTAALKAGLDYFEAWKGGDKFYGDGDLLDGKGGLKPTRQRLFLELVTAQSIREVLDAYALHDKAQAYTSTFKRYSISPRRWLGGKYFFPDAFKMIGGKKTLVEPIHAAFDYGSYQFGPLDGYNGFLFFYPAYTVGMVNREGDRATEVGVDLFNFAAYKGGPDYLADSPLGNLAFLAHYFSGGILTQWPVAKPDHPLAGLQLKGMVVVPLVNLHAGLFGEVLDDLGDTRYWMANRGLKGELGMGPLTLYLKWGRARWMGPQGDRESNLEGGGLTLHWIF